jgi:hypothetical protein
MRKWYVVLTVLGCAAIAIVTTRLAHRDEGPIFHGRPLSYWLTLEQTHLRIEDADEAVRHIGTNALPFLLKWIRYEPPPWRAKVLRATPQFLEGPVWHVTTSQHQLLAAASANAFRVLGTNAAGAVPELTALVRNTNAPQTAVTAMQPLTWIGPDGLAPLVSLIQDRRYPLRFWAVVAIAFTSTNAPDAAVVGPALVQCLTDTTNPQIPVLAAMWLDRSRYAPELSVPALAACVTNPTASEDLRTAALSALGSYQAQAASALPVITNALADPSIRVQAVATNAIRRITRRTPTNSQSP